MSTGAWEREKKLALLNKMNPINRLSFELIYKLIVDVQNFDFEIEIG